MLELGEQTMKDGREDEERLRDWLETSLLVGSQVEIGECGVGVSVARSLEAPFSQIFRPCGEAFCFLYDTD